MTEAIECAEHEWKETGVSRPHVQGEMFRYGTRIVTYVRCERCQQDGFKFFPSSLIYTWRKEDA